MFYLKESSAGKLTMEASIDNRCNKDYCDNNCRLDPASPIASRNQRLHYRHYRPNWRRWTNSKWATGIPTWRGLNDVSEGFWRIPNTEILLLFIPKVTRMPLDLISMTIATDSYEMNKFVALNIEKKKYKISLNQNAIDKITFQCQSEIFKFPIRFL